MRDIHYRFKTVAGLLASLLIAVVLVMPSLSPSRAQTPDQPVTAGRARKAGDGPAQASPTPPTRPADDDVTLQSDEVVRVDTNLTNIFFTAADKHKRFI